MVASVKIIWQDIYQVKCFNNKTFMGWIQLSYKYKMYNLRTTTIIMPLSWLAGVCKFWSYLLLPFLLIVHILFSQTILFQLLYTLFPHFPWLTLLPFPIYLNFHVFGKTALNYHIPNLQNNPLPYHEEHQWAPYHPTQITKLFRFLRNIFTLFLSLHFSISHTCP